jgi:Pheromone A receptor
MSMVIGIWGVAWGSFLLSNIIEYGLIPLPNWRTIHSYDSVVLELPLVVLSPSDLASYRLIWWGIPGAAYIFFLVFGTSRDIFLEYKRLWIWFGATVLGRRLPEKEWPMPMLPSG